MIEYHFIFDPVECNVIQSSRHLLVRALERFDSLKV